MEERRESGDLDPPALMAYLLYGLLASLEGLAGWDQGMPAGVWGWEEDWKGPVCSAGDGGDGDREKAGTAAGDCLLQSWE